MQLSHCIINIYTTSLSFGVSAIGTTSSSVEIISFLLLRKTSVDNSITYPKYKWVTGKKDPVKNKCIIS
jgi:hypothetical protein